MAPPGSIPNPEVKHTSADGSVGSPHVRVGHRQTSNKQSLVRKHGGFFYACSPDARRHRTAYVAHCARPGLCAQGARYHVRPARRALCPRRTATNKITPRQSAVRVFYRPCAQGARYRSRTSRVARQSPRRAQNAYATRASRRAFARAVRPRRTLRRYDII